jgi:hypothetical protein
MASDTTLLVDAIKEGMADFIGERISGKSANQQLLIYAKGKEEEIWKDFNKELHLNRGYNWIGNGGVDKETEKPADLGYWGGYQICKADYSNAKNRKQAIAEMFRISNYKQFLIDSKWE